MRNSSYKWYLLGLLVFIQAFSGVDRLALGLLTQDIKLDLSLSDTQIGALDGMAFALFYATMGIPIARWADRGHRGRIVAVTTALWAIAVPLCGAARSFVQLVLIRVLAGSGEAGVQPTTGSLLSDFFGRAERARAMTISNLQNPLGTAIGYGVAGWIAQHYGWRITFVVLGMPGVLLAILAAFTVREPRTCLATATGVEAEGRMSQSVSFWQTCVALWSIVSFRHMVAMFVIQLFADYGTAAWEPSFFVRSYGMKDEELGLWLTVTTAVSGFVGTLVGGELAHRFLRKDEPLQLKWMAIVWGLSTIMQEASYLTHDRYLALGLVAASMVVGFTCSGPLSAIQLTIVPERMRATSTGVVFLLGNLIGMGLGPLAAGALSDLLHRSFGDESLRYVLLILTPIYFLCSWHMWAARKTVLHDASMAEIDVQGARADKAVATQTSGSAL